MTRRMMLDYRMDVFSRHYGNRKGLTKSRTRKFTQKLYDFFARSMILCYYVVNCK